MTDRARHIREGKRQRVLEHLISAKGSCKGDLIQIRPDEAVTIITALYDLKMAKQWQEDRLRKEYERGYANGRADEAGLRDGTIMQTFSPD